MNKGLIVLGAAMLGVAGVTYMATKQKSGNPPDENPPDENPPEEGEVVYSNASARIGDQFYHTNYCAVYYEITVHNQTPVPVTKTYYLYRLITQKPISLATGIRRAPDIEGKNTGYGVTVTLAPGESADIMLPLVELIPNTEYVIGTPWRTAHSDTYGDYLIDYMSDYYLVDEAGLETQHINLPC